jgi:hypothetical protein
VDDSFRFALLMVLPAAALGCGNEHPGLAPYGGGAGQTNVNPGACSTPQEGCPCDQPGQVVECGVTKKTSGDYVSCAMGERTCGDDDQWQGCVESDSEFLIVPARPSSPQQGGPGNHSMGLGPQTDCVDVCDPYCQQSSDTPSGITPPTGIDTLDGSVVTNSKDENTIASCTGIAITGATDLTVTQITPSVSPNSLSFNVGLVPSTCYLGALPNAAWSIEASKIDRAVIIGAAQTGTLTVVNPVAGPIVITARLAGFTATTTANIKVNVGPALAASVLADDTSLLYPYDGTVIPLSLTPPIVQWNAGTTPATVSDAAVVLRYPAGSTAATALFEWRGTQGSETATLPITVPVPPSNTIVNLTAGRRFPNIPAAVWKVFEQTAKGANADVILRRKSTLGWHQEKLRTIRFAQGQLKGSIYYQSYGTQLARNFAGGALPNVANDPTFPGGVFGAATLAIRPGATSPTVIAGAPTSASDTSGSACRVCHTASASGNVLITQKFGGANQVSLMGTNLQATTPTLTTVTGYTDGRTAWPALYPDGSFLFSNAGIKSSYNTGPAPGGLDGSDNTVSQSALYTLSGAGVAGLMSGVKYVTSGATQLTVTPTAGAGNWALKGATPVFSGNGKAIAMVHASGKVCPTGTAGCNTAETRTGDKRSLAVVDYDPTNKRLSNFRIVVDQPATPCNTSFHALQPCFNVWPSFLPNNTAIVYEQEVFHNGNVGGTGATSDYAGTRSGCDNSGVCNNDGAKGELWWTNINGASQPTRLNRANGLTSAGALDIPTGATNPTCKVGTMLCTANAECCSGSCSGSGLPGGVMMCKGIVKYAGNTCAAASECESGVCTAGVCTGTKPAAVINQPYLAGHSALVEPVLNYEPTVNPDPTFTTAGAPEYYWVVFTSRRQFGNIATINPFWSDPRRQNISKTVTPKKLWVAAISANPTPGTDPSFPAFYLPGQEWISGNSKGYWVQDACTAPNAVRSAANECQSNADCCGAPTTSVCSVQTPIANPVKRHCVPVGTCSDLGGACGSDTDCCGGNFCTNGTCQNPPSVVNYNPATFTRDYEGVCAAPMGDLQWRFFEWQANLPAGTSIKFSAQTAATQAGLDTATPTVVVATASPPSTTGWTSGPQTVGDVLKAAGVLQKRWLRITMLFNPSADKTKAPELTAWRQKFSCLYSE